MQGSHARRRSTRLGTGRVCVLGFRIREVLAGPCKVLQSVTETTCVVSVEDTAHVVLSVTDSLVGDLPPACAVMGCRTHGACDEGRLCFQGR